MEKVQPKWPKWLRKFKAERSLSLELKPPATVVLKKNSGGVNVDDTILFFQNLGEDGFVKELHMPSYGLGPKLLMALASECLALNRRLKLIDLSRNDIKPPDLLAFAQCISGKNFTLQAVVIEEVHPKKGSITMALGSVSATRSRKESMFMSKKTARAQLAIRTLKQVLGGNREVIKCARGLTPKAHLLKRHDIELNAIDNVLISIKGGGVKELVIEESTFSYVPYPAISALVTLTHLTLRDCGLTELPISLRHLSKLKLLNAAYNDITAVADFFSLLPELESLNLSYNRNLKDLPMSVFVHPKLSTLAAYECPLDLLPFPIPRAVRSTLAGQSEKALLNYCRSVCATPEVGSKCRLVFLGDNNVGKTTTIVSLGAKLNNFLYQPVLNLSTDGIDMGTLELPPKGPKEQRVEHITWDFAGHTAYYTTYKMMLSHEHCVAVICFNVGNADLTRLDFWIQSVLDTSDSIPIFIVGTHIDVANKLYVSKLHSALVLRYNVDAFPFLGVCFVSNITGKGIPDLIAHLSTVTTDTSLGKKIGLNKKIGMNHWRMQYLAKCLARDFQLITFQEWKNYACGHGGIDDDVELLSVTKYLSDMGHIRYYDAPNVGNYVVLNPNVIIDVVSILISSKSTAFNKGFLTTRLAFILENFDPGVLLYITNLLALHHVLYIVDPRARVQGVAPTIQNNKQLFFPALLGEASKKELAAALPHDMTQVTSLEASMKDSLTVYLLGNGWQATHLWRRAAVFTKRNGQFICLEIEDTALLASASKNACKELWETIGPNGNKV